MTYERIETPMLSPESAADPWGDDDFWQSFELEPDYVPRTPWYRKSARFIAALIVAAMLATGALIPWGTLIDRLDNVSAPADILALADEAVAESPYGWLVSDVRIRDIPDSSTGGFVHNSPATGIVTLDLRGWEPSELRSVVAHEIGHLLDFAAYGDLQDRRDGLASETWAECAAVDAGHRRVDANAGDTAYHCTRTELEQYRFAVSRLGEVCQSWGQRLCQPVTPIGD